MLDKCANCGARALKPVRDPLGVFCSKECRDFTAYPGFCPECTRTTIARSTGNTVTFNGIGATLYGSKAPCPVCGSVIRTYWFCVFFVPLLRFGRYRVKYTQPGRFLSRLVTDRPVPPLPANDADLATLRAGLHSPHPEMREHCASLLGDRGAAAQAAVAELTMLQQDPNRQVRNRAKWAVQTIARKSGT